MAVAATAVAARPSILSEAVAVADATLVATLTDVVVAHAPAKFQHNPMPFVRN